MFGGTEEQVRLRFSNRLVGVVLDRFGKDVQVDDAGDGTARVSVVVMGTPVFFGWVSQFEGQVVIEQPTSLRKTYANYLRGLLESYE